MSQETIQHPPGFITDIDVSATAAIQACKFTRHQSIDTALAAPGVAITAFSKYIHVVKGASGKSVDLRVIIDGAAIGAYATTVDLQKPISGTFTTILSAPITLNSSSPLLTPIVATIAIPSNAQDDVFKLVVAQTGSGSGSQSTGGVATLTYEETEV